MMRNQEQSNEKLVFLNCGVRVFVPEDIRNVSSYVLQEQGDWFEYELGYLRKIVEPGQVILDIGSCNGVYALSLAKQIGPNGKVFAFEPNPTSVQRIRRSIESNSFSNIFVDSRAVSDRSGYASLGIEGQAEFHSLVDVTKNFGPTIPVKTATLDELAVEYAWEQIDVLKLDAEGSEEAILRSGTNFFRRYSPIVLVEVRKDQHGVNKELIRSLEAKEMKVYRLLPELSVVVPLCERDLVDPYLLNVFAIPNDRVPKLRESGFLSENRPFSATTVGHFEVSSSKIAFDSEVWKRSYPFSQQFVESWRDCGSSIDCELMKRIVLGYAHVWDNKTTTELRLHTLSQLYGELSQLVEAKRTIVRLSTFARIANDLGERDIAIRALEDGLGEIHKGASISAEEPFLPCLAEFDGVPTQSDFSSWILASLVAGIEEWSYFSSFYTLDRSRKRLEALKNLGYLSVMNARRLNLVCQLQSRL